MMSAKLEASPVDKHKAQFGDRDQANYLILAKQKSAQKNHSTNLFDDKPRSPQKNHVKTIMDEKQNKETEITESNSYEEDKPLLIK